MNEEHRYPSTVNMVPRQALREANSRIAQLEAEGKRFLSDWLAMLKLIAALHDVVEETDEWEKWEHADDLDIIEQFDPWATVRVAIPKIEAWQKRITELEAEFVALRQRVAVWKAAAKRHRKGRHVAARIAAREIAASVRLQGENEWLEAERDDAREAAEIWQGAAMKFAGQRDEARAQFERLRVECATLLKQNAHAWDMEAEASKRARKISRQLDLANESVRGYYRENKKLRLKLEEARIRLGICPECENEECMADGVNLWCPACDASYTLEE